MIFKQEDIESLVSDNETLIYLTNSKFGTPSDRTIIINYTKKDIANNPIMLAAKDLTHKHNNLALKIVNASKNKAKNNIKAIAKTRGLI